MKKFIFVCTVCSLPISLFAQKNSERVDTLYYDGEWKGATHKAFAEYYRIALHPEDPSAKKVFRDFFIDGTLQGKGEFISIDANDDSKSVFNGVIEAYYKNGNTAFHKVFTNGVLDGDFVQYYENGLIKSKGAYRNGKQTGLFTQFNEDGSFYQHEYSDGNPLYDYYVFSDPDGRVVKFKLSDNTIYWESPELSERKNLYKDGVNWLYYSKNGLTIAEACSKSNDYGKWHKIDIVISNQSVVPIEFDPLECVSAFSVDNNMLPTDLDVWSSDEYIKKVNRAHTWAAIALGISEGLAAANAGYSTSTTTSSTSSYSSYNYGSYSGSGNSYGHLNYSGYSTSTSATRTYDVASAYQAQVVAQQRMADFDYVQWQVKKAKEVGYLRKNTIQPGETISGYINIKRIDGVKMFNTITIGDASYHFAWTYGNNAAAVDIPEGIDYLSNYANTQIDNLELMVDNNDKKLKQKITDFFYWIANADIKDSETINRVINLEKRFFDAQFEQLDYLIENNKMTKADYLYSDIHQIYNVCPIQIDEVEERLQKYDEEFTPKKEKTFRDGVYA